MKKVAFIQSDEFFNQALQDQYLHNIPVLTSTDAKEIYKFIKKNALKKCILKYVLDINSNVLDKLIDYISLKRDKCSCCSIIDKCTLMATRSNATNVREKNILKKTNIFFTLTTIGIILNTYTDNRLFVVSNTQSPYYNEIFNFKKTNNFRISDLTVDILNQYKGSSITCALDTPAEYTKYVSLILQSNYRRFCQFFEINYLEIVKSLDKVVFNINNISAGSGLVGNILDYPELNIFKIYENTSLMLILQASIWEIFIKNKIVSNKICDFSVSYTITF